jgi:hypothetical protein
MCPGWTLKSHIGRWGLEPLTPCLQSVNWLVAAEYNGLLSCCVLFAFRPLDWGLHSYRVR